MTVALLLALTQTVVLPVPPAPPPQIVPVVSTPMVPPPIVRSSMLPSGPPVLVDVRVTAGERILFADQLRVDGMMGASFAQNRSEAMEGACPADRYDRQQSSMFNLRLNARPIQQGAKLMTVSVSWSRPIANADCANTGSRTASINQTVTWEPGKPVVLTGDGGLRIELRPH